MGDGGDLQCGLRFLLQPFQLTDGFGVGPHADQMVDIMEIAAGIRNHFLQNLSNGHSKRSPFPFLYRQQAAEPLSQVEAAAGLFPEGRHPPDDPQGNDQPYAYGQHDQGPARLPHAAEVTVDAKLNAHGPADRPRRSPAQWRRGWSGVRPGAGSSAEIPEYRPIRSWAEPARGTTRRRSDRWK